VMVAGAEMNAEAERALVYGRGPIPQVRDGRTTVGPKTRPTAGSDRRAAAADRPVPAPSVRGHADRRPLGTAAARVGALVAGAAAVLFARGAKP
jgi:hypothetical protein